MDYNKDNLAKDKAQTWKTFNKLTIYTIIFVAIDFASEGFSSR